MSVKLLRTTIDNFRDLGLITDEDLEELQFTPHERELAAETNEKLHEQLQQLKRDPYREVSRRAFEANETLHKILHEQHYELAELRKEAAELRAELRDAQSQLVEYERELTDDEAKEIGQKMAAFSLTRMLKSAAPFLNFDTRKMPPVRSKDLAKFKDHFQGRAK